MILPNYKNIIIGVLILIVTIRFFQIRNARLKKEKENNMEGFMNPNPNHNSMVFQAFPFESYYELKETNIPVIKKSYIKLPILRFNTNNFYPNNSLERITYNDKIVNYMKKKIYPFQDVNTYNSLDTILKIINGEIDMAFINEEILYKYINKNQDILNLIPNNSDSSRTSFFENGYEKINFSVMASCFYVDMFLITYRGNPLNRLSDVISPLIIGCTPESSIFIKKIVSAHQFTNQNIIGYTIYETNEELINTFNNDDIEYMFLLIHTKDNYLLDLTFNKRVKFIHLYKNLNEIRNSNVDENDFIIEQSLTSADFYNHIRSKEANPDLLTDQKQLFNYDEDKETFNTLLKRYIPNVYPRVIDLNSFYPSDNDYSYLETYSIKYLLIGNDDIDQKYIDFFMNNFISNLDEIKYKIIENEYIIQLENFNNYDLNIEELLVFNEIIPLHKKVKNKYQELGLLNIIENKSCQI